MASISRGDFDDDALSNTLEQVYQEASSEVKGKERHVEEILDPDKVISKAIKKFINIKTLREEQTAAIKTVIFERRDTIALLPTGYGKSLVYQLLPEIHRVLGDQRRVVLVVSPLTAIMKEQVKELLRYGMKAAMLDDESQSETNVPKPASGETAIDHQSDGDEYHEVCHVTLDNVMKGEVDVVFASAEKWLSKKWKHELKNGQLGKCISEIAVDEVHTVLEW